MTASFTSKRESIPQQLVVPITIGRWTGKAVVDTGASYTLLHESLWTALASSDPLQTWALGPLYLANGETAVPVGWTNIEITLHNQVFFLPAAILSNKALAYSVVLGLDFIFTSGLQINVADGNYSFKSIPNHIYPFQPGQASTPIRSIQHLKPKAQLKNA